jgi:hypothetical protein
LFRAYSQGKAGEANPFRWVDPREMLGDAARGESMKRPMRKLMRIYKARRPSPLAGEGG